MNEKKRKILIGLGIGFVTILIALVIGIAVAKNMSVDMSVDAEPEETGELVGDTKNKFLVFENLDFLTMVYNIKSSTTIAEDIENCIFSSEEMQYSGENTSKNGDKRIYYDAVIDVAGFSSYDALNGDFGVEISDGRRYRVVVRTDSLNDDFTYLYVAITRDGSDVIWVFVNGDETKEGEFVNFVKDKMKKNLVKIKK